MGLQKHFLGTFRLSYDVRVSDEDIRAFSLADICEAEVTAVTKLILYIQTHDSTHEAILPYSDVHTSVSTDMIFTNIQTKLFENASWLPDVQYSNDHQITAIQSCSHNMYDGKINVRKISDILLVHTPSTRSYIISLK